jgi:hypothetical protein
MMPILAASALFESSLRLIAMTRSKDAAWEVMEPTYLKASSGGTLPAHSRQVMYDAGGSIQSRADRPLGKDFDKYFTQQRIEKSAVTSIHLTFLSRAGRGKANTEPQKIALGPSRGTYRHCQPTKIGGKRPLDLVLDEAVRERGACVASTASQKEDN